MRRQLCIYSMILFFASCNEKGDNYQRKRIGDKFIETIFIDDTTYQGLTKYYSLSNVLESEIEFKNGLKNGYSKNYYKSGVIHDSMNFVNGLANGYHFVYDSTRSLEYKDFFIRAEKVVAYSFIKEVK